jgi:hypothetical protein
MILLPIKYRGDAPLNRSGVGLSLWPAYYWRFRSEITVYSDLTRGNLFFSASKIQYDTCERASWISQVTIFNRKYESSIDDDLRSTKRITSRIGKESQK